MNYRHLGRSGLQVSELSLGSWVTYGNQVDTRAARELMAAAYDAGVNFFDNAEAYARGQAEEFVERYEALTPLRRMGTEDDMRGAVAWLAGDAAAYVTGQVIAVDGGWTAW